MRLVNKSIMLLLFTIVCTGAFVNIAYADVATDWNKTKAARQLRWSRMTLYRKIHQYDLRPRPMAAAN